MEKIRNPEVGQESTVQDQLKKLEMSRQKIKELLQEVMEAK